MTMRDLRRLVRAGLALSFCFMLGLLAAVVAPVFFRASGPAPPPAPAASKPLAPAAPPSPAPAARPSPAPAKPVTSAQTVASAQLAAPVFPKPQGPADFAQPVSGRVAVAFGWRRDPVFSDFRFHPGVDLAGRAGERVKAAYPGQVRAVARAGQDYGREPAGWEITVEHPAGWSTRYRFAGDPSVLAGRNVLKGENLGTLAGDGTLHFALYRDGRPVEPVLSR